MTSSLLEVARRQSATFCRAQAQQHGTSAADLLGAVATRVLRQPHPGVYVIEGSPDTPEQRMWIAYLAVRRPCAASGLASGWLHRLPGCELPAIPEIGVPMSRRPRAAVAKVRRLRWWDDVKVEMTTAGLPRLDVGSTMLTLAPQLGAARLLAVVQHVGFHDPASLALLRGRDRDGVPGARRLSAALRTYDLGHDSAPEVGVQRSLTRRGLAPDHCNVSLRTPDGALLGPYDGYYEVGVAYEYDGREPHDTVDQSGRDDRKSVATGTARVVLVRFDVRDLRDPARLERRTRTALRSATRPPGVVVVHAGNRPCLCGWAPGVPR